MCLTKNNVCFITLYLISLFSISSAYCSPKNKITELSFFSTILASNLFFSFSTPLSKELIKNVHEKSLGFPKQNQNNKKQNNTNPNINQNTKNYLTKSGNPFVKVASDNKALFTKIMER